MDAAAVDREVLIVTVMSVAGGAGRSDESVDELYSKKKLITP